MGEPGQRGRRDEGNSPGSLTRHEIAPAPPAASRRPPHAHAHTHRTDGIARPDAAQCHTPRLVLARTAARLAPRRLVGLDLGLELLGRVERR